MGRKMRAQVSMAHRPGHAKGQFFILRVKGSFGRV